ncbi:MAG: S49 family peptidase [Oceanicaulis sp.]
MLTEELKAALAALGGLCAVDIDLAAPYLAAAREAEAAINANGVRVSAAAVGQATTQGGVAILPVSGFIRMHPSPVERLLGISFGASLTRLTERLREAVADDAVAAIVLRFDSPGGATFGLAEAAEEIRKAASTKPVIAMVETVCASAAYWLASACSEIVALESAVVGSIGVVGTHTSVKAALEAQGVKVTLVSSTLEKVETYPENDLSDEARAHLQGLVDAELKLFVAAVAKGRGIKPGDVLDQYGRGRIMKGRAAKAAGMIDRIATLDAVVAGLARPARRAGAPRVGRAARMAFDL